MEIGLAIGILWDVSRGRDPMSGFMTFFLFAPVIVLLGGTMLFSLPLLFLRISNFWWDMAFLVYGAIGAVGFFVQQEYVYIFFFVPGLVGLSVVVRRLIAWALWKNKQKQTAPRVNEWPGQYPNQGAGSHQT
ncbi:hypothetical protein [Corynebacterium auriscanis]|uniref:hypothetical protein n=1 Tax=Corynebacterium auriscanis TaxID=99807 RepID=UPI0022457475|nr:hypothetical protein [Corynebacterium auriscanis]MCX2164098.1 hypothetical protein [Corynebacterium auriscanis]